MNILKKNTTPSFEIVPREALDTLSEYKIVLISEYKNTPKQEKNLTIQLLSNENYLITLQSFPQGKINEKFSYSIVENLSNKIVSLGKLMIVDENENIQDYTKQSNNKFYK